MSINHNFSPQSTLTKNTSFGFAFDSTAVITGSNNVTGAWTPLTSTVNGLRVDIGGVNFTGNLEVDNTEVVLAIASGNAYLASISGASQGTYSPNFAIVTGSQTTIPINTKSYSIAIESGYGFINGNLFNAGSTLNGGGYNGSWKLGSTIVVGTTGSAAVPSRIVIYYET